MMKQSKNRKHYSVFVKHEYLFVVHDINPKIELQMANCYIFF